MYSLINLRSKKRKKRKRSKPKMKLTNANTWGMPTRKNKVRSIKLLDQAGIKYEFLTADHIRVGEYDYWPVNGLFMHRETFRRGRGIYNLLDRLK